jgi:hypothetical protein
MWKFCVSEELICFKTRKFLPFNFSNEVTEILNFVLSIFEEKKQIGRHFVFFKAIFSKKSEKASLLKQRAYLKERIFNHLLHFVWMSELKYLKAIGKFFSMWRRFSKWLKNWISNQNSVKFNYVWVLFFVLF